MLGPDIVKQVMCSLPCLVHNQDKLQWYHFCSGKKYEPKVDVAILLRPKQWFDVDQYYKDEEQYTSLLNKGFLHSKEYSSFMFLDANSDKAKSVFKKYEDTWGFEDEAVEYFRNQPTSFDIEKRMAYALQHEFNEKVKSMGKQKILVIITDKPLKQELLEQGGGVKVMNFVYSSNLVNDNALNRYEARTVFGLGESGLLVDQIDALRNDKINVWYEGSKRLIVQSEHLVLVSDI